MKELDFITPVAFEITMKDRGWGDYGQPYEWQVGERVIFRPYGKSGLPDSWLFPDKDGPHGKGPIVRGESYVKAVHARLVKFIPVPKLTRSECLAEELEDE